MTISVSENPYRGITYTSFTGRYEVRCGQGPRHRDAIAVFDTLQEAIAERDRLEPNQQLTR